MAESGEGVFPMRRPIYTHREMEAAGPAEFGLEAVQGTAVLRPLGRTSRVSGAAVWPMDTQRRSVPIYQRSLVEGAPRSHSCGQMMASPMDDCEVSGSIYLVAVPR